MNLHSFLSAVWRLVRHIPGVEGAWGLVLRHRASRQRRALQRYGREILNTVTRALDGLDWNVEYGTLLGLMREKGFIAHDSDMDFGFRGSSAAEVWQRLEPAGFRLIHAFEYEGEIVELCTRYRGVTVDFFRYKTDADGRTFLCGWLWEPDNHGFWPGRRHPKPTIRRTLDYAIEGATTRIPENWEDVLVSEYGPHWRVSDPGWTYTGDEMLPKRARLHYTMRI